MRIPTALFVFLTGALLMPVPGVPQSQPDSTAGPTESLDPAQVPFGPGERMTYQVKLGVFEVGEGYMAVEGLDTVRGHPTYHVSMYIEGGVPFYHMEDKFDSWLDVRKLVSRRFRQDQQEGDWERHRQLEFFPEERRFERADNDEEGELPTREPLDDISFVYFVRSLPLKVGETYTFNRYFKQDGNPVTIKVLRKDRIKVPAGEFETIVVQPIIKTDGMFSEGGRAEIHFTDDERRMVVYMRSRIPVVGNLTLHLKEVEEGRRLAGARKGAGGGDADERTEGDTAAGGPSWR